jgi:hypothetical protein
MNIDMMIVRAMLRLARRREVGDEAALTARVNASRGVVRSTMRRLAACGLVDCSGPHPRLTMDGLALAVALLPARTRRPTPARPERHPGHAPREAQGHALRRAPLAPVDPRFPS